MLLDVVVEVIESLNLTEVLCGDLDAVLRLDDSHEVHEAQRVEVQCVIDLRIGIEVAVLCLELLCEDAVYMLDNFFTCHNYYYFIFFTNIVEFVPPKPKLFSRNMSKGCSMVSGMTLIFAVFSSGFSKLMLPAMNPFFIISVE